MNYSTLCSILLSLTQASAVYVSQYAQQPIQCPKYSYSLGSAVSSSSSSSSSSFSSSPSSSSFYSSSSSSSSSSTIFTASSSLSSSSPLSSSSTPVPSQLPSIFKSCPADLPLSCSTGALNADSCCVESPGGVLLQTQFWDYNPSTGPNDSWTIHGLWPDNCDGSYSSYCDDSMNVDSVKSVLQSFNEKELLDFMNSYWKDYQGNDDDLWTHEYNKHATCMSTLKPDCFSDNTVNLNMVEFFKQVTSMYKNLPSYEWLADAGIVPSNNVKYAKSDVAAALKSKFGAEVYFACDKNGAIDEIWYYYHLKGRVIDGDYQPIDFIGSNNCPDQVAYPPKNNYPSSSGSSSVPKASSAPTINGYLSPEGKTGCLISDGSWLVSGTCATYHLETASFGGYNLKSSKGYCGFVGGDLTCNSSVTATQFDLSSDGHLTYGGIENWSANNLPVANEKVKVESGSTESITFKLQFQKN